MKGKQDPWNIDLLDRGDLIIDYINKIITVYKSYLRRFVPDTHELRQCQTVGHVTGT